MGTLLEARHRLLIERLEAHGIQEAAFSSTSAAIVLRLPGGLANKLPKRSKTDPTPPHLSVLIVGDTSAEEWETVKRVTAQVAATTKPFRVSMDQYAEFHVPPPDPMTIPHMRVRGSVLPQLHSLLWERVAEAGIKVGHRYGPHGNPSRANISHFEAHVTLGFFPGDHVKYEGTKPTGGWTVGELEVWRGTSTKVTLKLGRPDVVIEARGDVERNLLRWMQDEKSDVGGGWDTARNLAAVLGVSRQAVQGVLKRLERSGVVERNPKALSLWRLTESVNETMAPMPGMGLSPGAPIKTGGWVHVRKPTEELTEHVVPLDALREGTLKVDVDGDGGEMRKMLDYIAKTAGIGHSFDVVVDPEDSKYKKRFDIDGDGPFKMSVSEGMECNECWEWIAFDRIADGYLHLGEKVVGICDGPDEYWCGGCARTFAQPPGSLFGPLAEADVSKMIRDAVNLFDWHGLKLIRRISGKLVAEVGRAASAHLAARVRRGEVTDTEQAMMHSVFAELHRRKLSLYDPKKQAPRFFRATKTNYELLWEESVNEARRLKFNTRQRAVLDALAHATEPGGNRPTTGASISSLVMFTDLTKAQVDRSIAQIKKKSELLGPWGDGLISWNADSPSKARKLWTGWLRHGKTPPTTESCSPMFAQALEVVSEALDLRRPEDYAAGELLKARAKYGVEHHKTRDAAIALADQIGNMTNASRGAKNVLNTHVSIEVRSASRQLVPGSRVRLAASKHEPLRARVVSLDDLHESKDAVLVALSKLHKTAVASMSGSPLARFAHTMTVITPKDIAAETGLNIRAVRRRLKQLEAEGKIRKKVKAVTKHRVVGGALTHDTWAPL